MSVDALPPAERYALRVLAQRNTWQGAYAPPEVVPALVAAGYVSETGHLTPDGRAAAQPRLLTRGQLVRRGISLREAALARRLAAGGGMEAARVLHVARMPEECPVCLGLGVLPPSVAGLAGRSPMGDCDRPWRLYPRVRPEAVVRHPREPGWSDLGWRRCECRTQTAPWQPPPAPERSPVSAPRPLDVVGTRRVVAVDTDDVSWDTPVYYGAARYTAGTWDRARWERWTKRQWVRRWAEDWRVPAWLLPRVRREAA